MPEADFSQMVNITAKTIPANNIPITEPIKQVLQFGRRDALPTSRLHTSIEEVYLCQEENIDQLFSIPWFSIIFIVLGSGAIPIIT